MNTSETKVLVEVSLKKLQESIKREVNYKKEIADDKIALKAVLAAQEKAEPLDPEEGYNTYNEWIEQLGKEIKAGENSLDRIGKEKAEIVAFTYYLENAKEEPAK